MLRYSNLPKPTIVNRVIPKNAFDPYCSTKQKRLFTEKIEKIRWTHKLALETINLPSDEVKEIQLFSVELREEEGIQEAIRIIDKAIPYPILFRLVNGGLYKWVISKKHPHPTNEDNSVIDWTFESDWSQKNDDLEIDLKVSLDEVFKNLCLSVSGDSDKETGSIEELVATKKETNELQSKIQKIKSRIVKEKQFNKKVELNMKLQELERLLSKT